MVLATTLASPFVHDAAFRGWSLAQLETAATKAGGSQQFSENNA
jgi:hypothetical protein